MNQKSEVIAILLWIFTFSFVQNSDFRSSIWFSGKLNPWEPVSGSSQPNFNSKDRSVKALSYSHDSRVQTSSRLDDPRGIKNILYPKPSSTDRDNDLVPVYRAESDANKRLSTTRGILTKLTKKNEEQTLYLSIGGKPERTDDFMEQSRLRETKKIYSVGTGQHSHMPMDERHAKNLQQFDMNGQTIRWGRISRGLANEIISNSASQKTGKGKPIYNVDPTKDFNQFGIKGKLLTSLKDEIKLSGGIGQGATFFNRRRSDPAKPKSIWGNPMSENVGLKGKAKYFLQKVTNQISSFRFSGKNKNANGSFQQGVLYQRPAGSGTSNNGKRNNNRNIGH